MGAEMCIRGRPGTWRLEVRDGKGHAIRKYVNVGAAAGGAATLPAGDTPAHSSGAAIAWLLLAVSLLANVVFALAAIQTRSAWRRSSTAHSTPLTVPTTYAV